jgi:hypothetical protein
VTSAAIFIACNICCYFYRLRHLLPFLSPETSAAIFIACDICRYFYRL